MRSYTCLSFFFLVFLRSLLHTSKVLAGSYDVLIVFIRGISLVLNAPPIVYAFLRKNVHSTYIGVFTERFTRDFRDPLRLTAHTHGENDVDIANFFLFFIFLFNIYF